MKAILFCLFSLAAFSLSAQQGLTGEYYIGTNFDQKVLTRIDNKINFGWWNESPAEGMPPSYFSVRWTGWIIAPETGKYLFSAKVDDGLRLWVNDIPLINAWHLNNMGDFSNQITLEAGKSYAIRVDYFNDMREGEITLLWQLPSMVNNPNFSYANFKSVPAAQFSQTKVEPKPIVIASKSSTPKPKPVTPSVSRVKEPPKQASVFDKMDKDLTVKQVFFIRSVNQMTENSIERLDKIVTFLKQNASAKIELNGHTDVMGDVQKNMELSISRTKVVADYLISKGVAESRILSKGYGGNQPIIAEPKTEEERAVNRRVEFVIKRG
jgi:outer membrane protein OmpA-like peptidoglycan-associated protein